MPPPGQNYDHRYLDSFEEAKRALGLTGLPFEYFWQDIAAVLDEQPFNVYSKEAPDISGLWVYPTGPEHPDFVFCLVLYSVEADVARINYHGLAGVKDGRLVVPSQF